MTDHRTEKKREGGRTARSPRLPKGHRCYGCASYGNGCVGLCHRDLIIKRKSEKGGISK